jgi:hypothetical protein
VTSTTPGSFPVMRPVDARHPNRPMPQADIQRVDDALQQRYNGDYIDFDNPDPVYGLHALAKGAKALSVVAAPVLLLASDGAAAPLLADTKLGSVAEKVGEFGKELVKSQVIDWVRQGIGAAITAGIGYAVGHLHRAPSTEKTP